MSCVNPCAITLSKLFFQLKNANTPVTVSQLVLERATGLDGTVEDFNNGVVQFTDTTDGLVYVPICAVESVELQFASAAEQQSFITNVLPLLQTSLKCCDCCEPVVTANFTGDYTSETNPEITAECNYLYYTSCNGTIQDGCDCKPGALPQNPCSCQECVGRLIDPCKFVNCCSERVRRFLEEAASNLSTLDIIKIGNFSVGAGISPKQILSSGVGTIGAQYDDGTNFYIAIVCLDAVTYFTFA